MYRMLPMAPQAAGLMLVACVGLAGRASPQQWIEVRPGPLPPAHSRSPIAYDESRSRVVLVAAGRTWEWDGLEWAVAADTAPAGAHAKMIYDPDRQRCILFSGATWQWRGYTWERITTLESPGVRWGTSMAFDRHRSVIVLFGGMGSPDDTWEFDGREWRSVLTWGAPQPRFDAAMGYDPQTRRVVLFGGQVETPWSGSYPVNEMWAFDGVQWSQQTYSTPLPYGRSGAHLAAFGDDRTLIVFGGQQEYDVFSDTWDWNLGGWLELHPGSSPPPTRLGSMTWDGTTRSIMLIGGEDRSGRATDAQWSLDRDPRRTFEAFGASGPASFGRPLLTARPHAKALTGRSYEMQFEGLSPNPLHVAFGMIGGSRTQVGTLPLPIPLQHWGMDGSWLYIRNDAAWAIHNAGGTARWVLDIPDVAALADQRIFVQGLIVDPAANPLGLVTTNAGSVLIRNP